MRGFRHHIDLLHTLHGGCVGVEAVSVRCFPENLSVGTVPSQLVVFSNLNSNGEENHNDPRKRIECIKAAR